VDFPTPSVLPQEYAFVCVLAEVKALGWLTKSLVLERSDSMSHLRIAMVTNERWE
jgi:hypothetical protein